MPHWPSVECFWLLEILFHPGAPSAGGTAGRWRCLGWWSGSLWCWLHQKRPCPGSCWKNPERKEHKWLVVEQEIISSTEKKKHLKTALAGPSLASFLILCNHYSQLWVPHQYILRSLTLLLLERVLHFFALHFITLSSAVFIYLFILLSCVGLFHVASSHQVGEDIVVSSAVFSRGHHLQVAGGDTQWVTSHSAENI